MILGITASAVEVAPPPPSLFAWNPSDKSSGVDLSNSNKTATKNAVNNFTWRMVRSVTSRASGLYYFEVTYDAGGDGIIGLAASGANLENFPGSDAFGMGYRPPVPNWFGTVAGTNGFPAIGDVTCFAADLNNRRLWTRQKGGNWNGSASNSPVSNVGGAAFNANMTGSVFIALGVQVNGQQWTLNTGQDPFAFSVPSGYSAWG